MKKAIITILILLIPVMCFAGPLQGKLAGVLERKNSNYCVTSPDVSKGANLVCEVPDGTADGLGGWTKGEVTESGVMDFAYSCDNNPALGCADISTTYCIREALTTNTESDFIAYKLLSSDGLTGNVYVQAYLKVNADAYESDGTTPMTYPHDIELLGINPLGSSGAMSVYLGFTGGYTGSTSHRPSLSLYYMADRGKGGSGPATLICTDTSYDGTTNTFCEIEGRSTISVDTWIGVRIHIYNSGTADSDTIQFWVDWDNDGNFTDLGQSTGVNLQNALKYIYMGNFGFTRKYDVQITGIKVSNVAMPPACVR